MTKDSFLDCERKSADKLKNFQLPNYFIKIGLAIAILSFISFFFTEKAGDYRLIGKYGMLLGMLLISISKGKIEDELIVKLRMQSYGFAFIIGVVYAMVLPFVDYFIDVIFNVKNEGVKDMADFQILWMLLSIQVFYFEFLKRLHR